MDASNHTSMQIITKPCTSFHTSIAHACISNHADYQVIMKTITKTCGWTVTHSLSESSRPRPIASSDRIAVHHINVHRSPQRTVAFEERQVDAVGRDILAEHGKLLDELLLHKGIHS
jgi:hypothetical protein